MEPKPTYKVNETRALTTAPQLTPQTWSMITEIGPAMHKARLFGVSNAEQAMAIMLKGYELGLSLTASFEFVQVIQGHVGLSPRGCLALIQQSSLCKSLAVKDIEKAGVPHSCRVTMTRSNDFSYTVEVTMDDAQRAGLVKPGSGWEKWPANMLRWRAVGFCADVVFPDVIGGMKRSDELGADLTEDGDPVVDTEWTVTVPESPESSTESTDPPLITNAFTTVKALLALWTPEQIMTANEGKIPATSEECLAVAEKLGVGQ